jgi:hypothetical protein
LVLDAAQQNLYGTTQSGGIGGWGTLFTISSTGAESFLYSFTAQADGAIPQAPVVVDTKDNIYGTKASLHSSNLVCTYGTVFEFNRMAGFNTIFSFHGADGGIPSWSLLLDSHHNLYSGSQLGSESFNNGLPFELPALE